MRPLLATCFLSTLAAIAQPAQLSAQAHGGWLTTPGTIRAEYYAEVIRNLNEVAADWQLALSTDNVDDLMELYAEKAVVVTADGASLRTHEDIRSFFGECVRAAGRVEAFMLDFDASGQMAMVHGNLGARMTSGPDAGREVRGPMVTVYLQEGRTWRIRSQMFGRGK